MKISHLAVPLVCMSAFAFGLIATAPVSRAAPEPDAQRILEGKLNPALHVVRLDHRFGPVTVIGADQDFGWRWVLSCSGDKAQAEAFAKDCQLEVQETDSTLDIRFVPAERGAIHSGGSTTVWKLFGWVWSRTRDGLDVNSSLELRLPRAVTLELQNRFGSVKAAGIRGPLNLDCQNSNVDIADIAGAVTATTTFGRLHVERTGAARLRTQNGEIQASQIGGDVHATTSFARLLVQDVKGRADLKNQNGEIAASKIAGDLVAASSFASIQVQDVAGRVDLHGQNSRIDARRIRDGIVAESSFAELRVEDIGGTAALKCQNGRIDALRVGSAMMAANSFAPLRVEDIRGDAILESQNGEITAHGVTGAMSAKTSFARMQLDGDGKRFEARNQNGAVQITARSPAVERIAATTSFGPIDVSLPPECKPLIRANTSFGKVRSAFPVLLGDTLPEANFNADTSQPKITLHGQNGDIRVQMLVSR